MAGFKWTVRPEKAFADLYDDYAKRIIIGIERLARAYTAEIERYMKQSATWQDRTGNLRASLYSDVERALTEIVLFFDYGLDYGYWLEYSGQGKYAIIAPTLDVFGARFWNDVKRLVEAK